MSRKNILFITGSDTGIGKTAVGALLAAALVSRGLKVRASKPIETGCGDALVAEDAELLGQTAASGQEISEIVFYRFRTPVGPYVAAQLEGGNINPAALVEQIRGQSREDSLLIVEGAGGLLVPISANYSFADLAKDCGAAVLVVVGSRLGAINHAALTFEALRLRGLNPVGYVFNDLFSKENDPRSGSKDALATNRAELRRIAEAYGMSEIGAIPYDERFSNLAGILELSSGHQAQSLADGVVEYFSPAT